MWRNALIKLLNTPDELLLNSTDFAIIADKYPKAHYHFLAVAKSRIDSLKEVTADDLGLLEDMDRQSREFASKYSCDFRFGYHAEPSMARLHLHIISDDLDSPTMRTAKHWNSFTTPFFVESSDVIEQLESDGEIRIPSKIECRQYLKTPLKCHKCTAQFKTMPALKNHVASH